MLKSHSNPQAQNEVTQGTVNRHWHESTVLAPGYPQVSYQHEVLSESRCHNSLVVSRMRVTHHASAAGLTLFSHS
jgi:hypothetical protein